MDVKWSAFRRLTMDNIMFHSPREPGVYLLWVKLQYGAWRCCYAGQADNLRQQLFAHCDESEPCQCLKEMIRNHVVSYEYAPVESKADRDGIQKYLYDYFHPACNKTDPGGIPLAVNLPLE